MTKKPILKDKTILTGNYHVLFALIACIVGALMFVYVAYHVRNQEYLWLDRSILYFIRDNFTSPGMDKFISVATDIGGVAGIAILGSLLAGYLAFKNRWRRFFFVVSSVAGAVLINLAVKSVFERSRPELWERIVNETSFSFPSGHAMASSALAFAFIVSFWHLKKWRWLVVGIAALYIVFVGFSRLYLGVHFPTDVLGGWIMSATWVSIVFVAYSQKHRDKLKNIVKKSTK